MTNSQASQRQKNFRLLLMYFAVVFAFSYIHKLYRTALQDELVQEGLSRRQVLESLQYNTNSGMVGVFLGWVCFICILYITYHEPSISDRIVAWIRKVRKLEVDVNEVSEEL
ncbi:hypothetical protein CCB80_01100 [Armatimonadetes bacterium Uphvl-Ar1]|nr:hypothetical protein CCB80_01100 [Armatimonadetes bacterium Uphvl-Ar1]